VQTAKKKAEETNFSLDILPQPLDIAQLYDVDANPHMWMINATPTDVLQLPPYLADDDVRRGILSVLVQDRVREEIFRLQAEHHNLIQWLDIRLKNIKATIVQCDGICSWLLCYKQ
jgi:hypothetical protein